MTPAITDSPRERAAHLGPERRRPLVLDAALAIAAEHGVAAVTIGSVAEQMGVTRPVVYACYPSRVELIGALVEREESLLLQGTLDALAPRVQDASEEVFVAGFQALLATVATRSRSWRLVFDGAPDPAVAELFGRGRALVAAEFESLLTPALTMWKTADAARKVPVLVEFFMSSGEGAVRSLLDGRTDWSPHDLGEFVGKAVYRAMRDA